MPCSTSTRPRSPLPSRDDSLPGPSAGRTAFFSRIQRIGRGAPVLGPSPAHPHPRQGCPYGLPANRLVREALLETHLGGHLHRPQAALLAELPGAPVEHLAQSLHRFLIEGPTNGVRTVRASSERLGKALLVELVDGIARGLRVTAKVAGNLAGVFAIDILDPLKDP